MNVRRQALSLVQMQARKQLLRPLESNTRWSVNLLGSDFSSHVLPRDLNNGSRAAPPRKPDSMQCQQRIAAKHPAEDFDLDAILHRSDIPHRGHERYMTRTRPPTWMTVEEVYTSAT